MSDLRDFVVSLPKAELHVHIEGTLEPEMLFSLAKRNGVSLPYANVDEVRAAYDFADLQAFLDLYYAGAAVLVTEEDFFDLTWAYLERAHADGVVHVEIFFDPQTHTERGIEFGTVLNGITRALKLGEITYGITFRLIMCFLRHLSEESALATLEQAMPFRMFIDGVGLDSGEDGNPPAKFERAFHIAEALGFRRCAHAGEEGPARNVRDALELLKAERIDHGVNAIHNPELVSHLADARIPLTMCPLSNQRLQVTPDLSKHPLKRFMNAGVLVTVNSDDPAYFGGYVADNYVAIAEALNLTREDLSQLAENSLLASWR